MGGEPQKEEKVYSVEDIAEYESSNSSFISSSDEEKEVIGEVSC